MENQTIKLERFKQAVFEDAEKQAKLITESADKPVSYTHLTLTTT